jgi:hypothetical protein
VSVRRRRALLAILATIALAAFAAGSYGGWILWHPMDAVLLWLVAGALVIVGVLLALVPRRGSRLVALGLVVAGVGLLAGVTLGPSRPELIGTAGRLDLRSDRPVEAEGSHDASCQRDEGATELQVSGDPNLRLPLFPVDPAAPADIDQRAFVSVGITVGDRWRDGTLARSDDVDLVIHVAPVQGDRPEITLVATDSSALDIDWTASGGTLRFSGLRNASETDEAAATALDLAGTISWTC